MIRCKSSRGITFTDIGLANGELAAWIDGKLYIHYRGFPSCRADYRLRRDGA